MSNGLNGLREFGPFRLDTKKHVLWHDNRLVDLSLKEIGLLSALTREPGAVVTKTELMDQVWPDSFVEESNLSRHIYILRKTLDRFGVKDVIETVPRRGYRFAGEVREVNEVGFVVETHSRSQTLVEVQEQTRPIASRRAVAALLLTAVVAAAWVASRYLSAGRGTKISSVAVLPFKTFDGSDQSHRGLGLADLLINRLSGINQITVRPTRAVVPFETTDADPIDSGKSLNVDAVLDGTIYRTGDKVRVTARLLNVADSSALWTGQFERMSADEMRIQDEIASQVAGALRLNLNAGDQEALTKKLTDDPEAFQLYLRGRYEWNKRNWAGAIEAERSFRNAIEKDPDFALAYVGLADALATGGTANAELAFGAVAKALENDPNLAEGYATRGFLKMFHRWDWQGSEADLKRSLDLNGGYATAHHWYAELLAIRGRFDEAKAEMRRAIEIDPMSHNFLADLGQIYYFNREYGEAEKYCRQALELAPDFQFAHNYLFYTYLKTGQYDQAAEALLAADEIQMKLNMRAVGEEKRIIEADLERRRRLYREEGINGFIRERTDKANDPGVSYVTASSYAFVGETEKALDRLEKAVDGHAFLSAFVKADPIFDNLRVEPRFQTILQKMKLAD